jgi:hypothetical protein
MRQNNPNIIQPSQVFDYFEIPESERDRAEKVFSSAFTFLISLDIGDKIMLSSSTFTKIGEGLLHIDVNLDPKNIINDLSQKKIIKITI